MESMLVLNNLKTIKPLTLMPPHTLTLGLFFGAGNTVSLSTGTQIWTEFQYSWTEHSLVKMGVAPAVMAVTQTSGQSRCLVGIGQ